MGRSHMLSAAMLVIALAASATTTASAADVAFQRWLEGLWDQAQSMGISRRTFDAATRGVEPDLTLPDLELPGRVDAPPRGQAEFVQTPADYLKEANIARLAERAKALAAEHGRTLAAIEQRFGVPGNVLLAIWGRETAFGGYKLPKNAITVLATQGYYGRRKDMFREELLYALKMLDEGHIKLADMRSSWGGAMGLTQFLPSEFYKHAIDFDGDGRKDIWHSVPDALASAAQQLVNKGWQRGTRWAYEVRPPQAVDCTIGFRRRHSRCGSGSSRDSCLPMGASRRPPSSPSRPRCCSPKGPTARPSSRSRTTTSSRSTISPISTCCSSAI